MRQRFQNPHFLRLPFILRQQESAFDQLYFWLRANGSKHGNHIERNARVFEPSLFQEPSRELQKLGLFFQVHRLRRVAKPTARPRLDLHKVNSPRLFRNEVDLSKPTPVVPEKDPEALLLQEFRGQNFTSRTERITKGLWVR